MPSIFGRGSALSKESANMIKREVDEEEGSSQQDHMSSSHDLSKTSSGPKSETNSSSFNLAQNETKMLKYSKLLILLLIAGIATVTSIITYKFVRKQESDEYHAKFRAIASEVQEFSQIKIEKVFDNLESFGVGLTSFALDANVTWPFVLYPDFQVKGILSNEATGSHTLTLNPIVYPQDIETWSKWSVANSGWMETAHERDKTVHEELYELEYHETDVYHDESLRWNVTGITPFVWKESNNSDGSVSRVPVGQAKYYAPMWQNSPACDYSPLVNNDLRSWSHFEEYVDALVDLDHAVLTEVVDATYLRTNYDSRFDPAEQEEPHSYLLSPVYNTLTKDRKQEAFLSAFFRWGIFFDDVLPSDQRGIWVVLHSTCGPDYTYEIFGHKAVYMGIGDKHEREIDEGDTLKKVFEIAPFAARDDTGEHHLCHFTADVYPSQEWKSKFFSDDPYIFSGGIAACFVVTTFVFVLYDLLVQRRQDKVMASAKRTNAIVASLFPSNVRDRLLDAAADDEEGKQKKTDWNTKAFKTKEFNSGDLKGSEAIFGSKPIADLFPETTILFMDMVGFTAWSSVREPSQVFSLLETVYHSFDVIAKRRRVFKVETVGDCYVAVAGLPVPRKDHAIVMCKFADECCKRFKELTHGLEISLGPDTAELSVRCGLHSGPVTAGVLRGEKGRFQLFGDTMNTASRIESTGVPGKIHCSKDTADLLIEAGREKWVIKREDQVVAKGKGSLETFFVKLQVSSTCTGSQMSTASRASNNSQKPHRKGVQEQALMLVDEESGEPKTAYDALPKKVQRLVTWNVDMLAKSLKQVIARRASRGNLKAPTKRDSKKMASSIAGNVLDEVKDVLNLPQQFDAKCYENHVDPNSVVLPDEVMSQLNDMISRIASLYHNNPFHNFEHASHVTMSITKLLARIIQPIEVSTANRTDDQIAANLHDHTFGITSDPLTQFACVLSGLIHDADHPGVPNMTLIKEGNPLAERYNGQSVAEQNSVDLTWDIVTSNEYKELQACIYGNMEEYNRFRSIIVNVVMATDIMDKDLGAARKARWEKAFNGEEENKVVAVNRKATIVLEHLMQASDVAHTMQHWNVFKKWNERLFCEMYQGYVDGRSETDPSKGWYQGEKGFFDYYIIPLARKLETCGIFGVSSAEYLNYALKNRAHWEHHGEQLVQEYLERFAANSKQVT